MQEVYRIVVYSGDEVIADSGKKNTRQSVDVAVEDFSVQDSRYLHQSCCFLFRKTAFCPFSIHGRNIPRSMK
jgi:hypothetical protein